MSKTLSKVKPAYYPQSRSPNQKDERSDRDGGEERPCWEYVSVNCKTLGIRETTRVYWQWRTIASEHSNRKGECHSRNEAEYEEPDATLKSDTHPALKNESS